MKPKEVSELTDAELLQEVQKIKSTLIINAVLIGIMIGVATYSTVKNGLGILTFFPLFFIPLFTKNVTRKKAVDQQIKERNLGK